MDFLNVEFLKKLEEETLNGIEYTLGSIGGGSTLFIISLALFLVTFSITIVKETRIKNNLENKVYKLKRHKKNEKELKNFTKTYKAKKEEKVGNWSIENNETYKKLSENYEKNKVSNVFIILTYLIIPFYLIIKTIDEIDNYFNTDVEFFIVIPAIILLLSGAFVGIGNNIEKEEQFEKAAYDNFKLKGEEIVYPVLHIEQDDDEFEIYFLDDNIINVLEYEGKVSINNELEINNEVLEKQIIVLSDDISSQYQVEDFQQIVGYITIESYTKNKKEYEQFKKENNDYLRKSEFEDYLEKLFYGYDPNSIKEMVLKSKIIQ